MSFIEQIVNVETGEIIEKPYSKEQLAEVEKAKAEIEKRLAQEAEKEMARKAIFEKLGLTEEEAKLLLS